MVVVVVVLVRQDNQQMTSNTVRLFSEGYDSIEFDPGDGQEVIVYCSNQAGLQFPCPHVLFILYCSVVLHREIAVGHLPSAFEHGKVISAKAYPWKCS